MKRMKKTKNVKIVSREMRVKQFKDVPPSQIFYNPSTTKWFRHRYNEDLIKKSIYSLFPNNCAPMLKEEEVTPMSILLEWLSHYLKPEKKYANIWINPKYFFSKSVYDKILKLKEIFLQFDEDGSRKMEIDEMVTMFKTNHIDVTEDDLCSLFFKGKKFRKEDINKLYLDFYQFMQFALSKASDQDFRIFMRKIKEKIMKEKENEKNKSKEENESEDNPSLHFSRTNRTNSDITKEEEADDLLNSDNANEPIFLPMNFNLVLDYFINKGKERKSQKKIRKAIKMMKNILKPGTYKDNDKDFAESDAEGGGENGSRSGSNSDSDSGSDSDNDSDKKKGKENEYDKQLKEINTELIMDEFEKLFKMSYTQGSVIETHQPKKKKKTFLRSSTLSGQSNNLKFGKQSTNNVTNYVSPAIVEQEEGKRKSKRFGTQKIEFGFGRDIENSKYLKKKEEEPIVGNKNNLIFTTMISNKIDYKSPKELTKYFYDKYHSIKIAKEETEKYLQTESNAIKNKKNSSYLPLITATNKKTNKKLITSLFGSKLKHDKHRFLY